MSLIAKESGGSASFDPVAAGMHPARCVGVVDLGTQESYDKAFAPKRQVLITWEIPSERIDIDEDGKTVSKPRFISNTYTLSLNGMSNLRKTLDSWRGRAFTAEELEGWDLFNILSAPCLLNVTHKSSKDGQKTYANVTSVNPLPKGMDCGQQESDTMSWSIDDQPDWKSTALELPTNVPEWVSKKIAQSEEYVQSHLPTEARKKEPNHLQDAKPAFDVSTGSDDEDEPPF